MLQGPIVVLISFAYLGLLFAIAYFADRRADEVEHVTADRAVERLGRAGLVEAEPGDVAVADREQRVAVVDLGRAHGRAAEAEEPAILGAIEPDQPASVCEFPETDTAVQLARTRRESVMTRPDR